MKTRIFALTTAALTAFSALAAVAPANAADFKVTADKSQNLNVAGETVNLTIEGLPTGQGVYLRLCAGTLAEVSKARPTNCVGQAATAWVTSDPVALRQGAKPLTGPVALALPATFVSGETKVDCTQVACGVHVRRDHLGGAADFSLDRFIPVTFGAPKASVSLALAGGKLQITAANLKGQKVTFVVNGKKFIRNVNKEIYVFSLPNKAKIAEVTAVVASKAVATAKL